MSSQAIGIYSKTTAPRIDGAHKLERAENTIAPQLERIAQALEDLVAANKDSFQRDMRDRFEKLEEIMEHQALEREARPPTHRGRPASIERRSRHGTTKSLPPDVHWTSRAIPKIAASLES